jgi:hypothetical protein
MHYGRSHSFGDDRIANPDGSVALDGRHPGQLAATADQGFLERARILHADEAADVRAGLTRTRELARDRADAQQGTSGQCVQYWKIHRDLLTQFPRLQSESREIGAIDDEDLPAAAW